MNIIIAHVYHSYSRPFTLKPEFNKFLAGLHLA